MNVHKLEASMIREATKHRLNELKNIAAHYQLCPVTNLVSELLLVLLASSWPYHF